MKDGGKGPAVQYRFVSTPKPITTFVQKDNKGKVTAQFPSSRLVNFICTCIVSLIRIVCDEWFLVLRFD